MRLIIRDKRTKSMIRTKSLKDEEDGLKKLEQKNFHGRQKDVRMVEANKVNKQGKGCISTTAWCTTNKVKYHCPA